MNGFGPVALIGGGEHRDATRSIDGWLLDSTGKARPRVTVVPVASSARKMPSTAALARSYWTSLGASVSFIVPAVDRSVDDYEGLQEPDVVVLTGGFPDRVIHALGVSPLWDRILDLWQAGTALSGSSAGSMALFDWRLRLLPPRPFELIPGLGPLTGYVALPHYDRYVGGRPRRRARLRTIARHFPGGHGIVGVDEGTALIGWDGNYQVVGRGAVTILDAGVWATHRAGSTVRLRMLPSAFPDAATATMRHLAA